MQMLNLIEAVMLSPCGVNCKLCSKYCNTDTENLCMGCACGNISKNKHWRTCRIRNCVAEKDIRYCFECGDFPCKFIASLDKKNMNKYHVSNIGNSIAARDLGIEQFMQTEVQKWTCPACGGIVTFTDGACSECGEEKDKKVKATKK